MRTLEGGEMRRIRARKGLTQEEFWKRVGVTQSGGCRYEKGRHIPRPVQLCLYIAYGSRNEKRKVVDQLIPPVR